MILSSKLPSAKEFKRWVTKEVLPSIRKTGSYVMAQNNTEWFASASEQLATLERYCVKIGKMTKELKSSVGFTNYMLGRRHRWKESNSVINKVTIFVHRKIGKTANSAV